MKLSLLMSLALLSFTSVAKAGEVIAQPLQPAVCTATEQAVWIVLKESFRYYPERRNGEHRFFVLVGCSNPTENGYRLSGYAFEGKEADIDYSLIVPKPLEGTLAAQEFKGEVADIKTTAHGSANAVQSDDGRITANGNFYSNRDISFTVDGNTVPASLLK